MLNPGDFYTMTDTRRAAGLYREDSRRPPGWGEAEVTAQGVSCMRQESHGRDSIDLDHTPPLQFMVLEARRVSNQDAVHSELHPTP